MQVIESFKDQVPITKRLQWSGVNPSNFYYKHEFAHIATPEDNAYIEAFHSIMERELVSRYEFESFHHADMKIAQYIFTYNHIRKHGSLGLRTPAAVWNELINNYINKKS